MKLSVSACQINRFCALFAARSTSRSCSHLQGVLQIVSAVCRTPTPQLADGNDNILTKHESSWARATFDVCLN